MTKRKVKIRPGWMRVRPLLAPAVVAALAVGAGVVPASAAAAAPAAPAASLASAPVVRQLITVYAPAFDDSKYPFATLRVYTLVGGKWVKVFGPWKVGVGYRGVAPLNQKREGDGRTPSGTYGFGFFFGVQPEPNPHFAFPFRRVYRNDYWDDDSASAQYNEWVVGTQNAGLYPEAMYNVPAYNYGAVIAYNTARIPHLGSAIFLHVGTGDTLGCVSLPQAELLKILHWLKPADNPRIRITAY